MQLLGQSSNNEIKIKYAANIVDTILSKESKRHHEELKELIERNNAAGGSKDQFLYGGYHHSLEPRTPVERYDAQILHPSLHADGREYVNSMIKAKAHSARLRSGVAWLLMNCRTLQDMRDALPDTIVFLVPDLNEMFRTRPVGWAFEGQPMQQIQNQEIMDLLEFYAVNHFLY